MNRCSPADKPNSTLKLCRDLTFLAEVLPFGRGFRPPKRQRKKRTAEAFIAPISDKHEKTDFQKYRKYFKRILSPDI